MIRAMELAARAGLDPLKEPIRIVKHDRLDKSRTQPGVDAEQAWLNVLVSGMVRDVEVDLRGERQHLPVRRRLIPMDKDQVDVR
jgi:hypothetical protein